jgi:hypothetical protein
MMVAIFDFGSTTTKMSSLSEAIRCKTGQKSFLMA